MFKCGDEQKRFEKLKLSSKATLDLEKAEKEKALQDKMVRIRHYMIF